MKPLFTKPVIKLVVKYGMVAVSGVVAVAQALQDQKKAQEFEALKKTVSELTKK